MVHIQYRMTYILTAILILLTGINVFFEKFL